MSGEALTAVVAPDEPVSEVLPHGCCQLAKSGLAGGEGLASQSVLVSILCMGMEEPATSAFRR